MNRPALIFGLILASTLSPAALAEHICTNSPNEVLVGYSPASNGVASMPICRWVEQSAAASTTPPRLVVERWEVIDDRFGAIAMASNGIYATSSDHRSKEDAEAVALALCARRGGEDCELKGGGANRNSCGTLVWGGGISFLDGNATPELSERDALEGCRQSSGKECRVVETYCSEPVSRWVYEKPDNWVPKQN